MSFCGFVQVSGLLGGPRVGGTPSSAEFGLLRGPMDLGCLGEYSTIWDHSWIMGGNGGSGLQGRKIDHAVADGRERAVLCGTEPQPQLYESL